MPMSRLKKNLLVLPTLKDIVITLAALAAAGIIGLLLIKINGDSYIQIVFVLVVAIVSRFTNGYLCGFIASLAGMLAVKRKEYLHGRTDYRSYSFHGNFHARGLPALYTAYRPLP